MTETIGAALTSCRATLAAAGIDLSALELRLLVAAATELPVETLIAWPERELPVLAAGRLAELTRRRVTHEPMAHILGRREFWGLDFAVTRDTLVPRPDSETLISAVLDEIPDRARALSILDLGTGTGCLLLALLSELKQAHGTGIDCSEAALAIARRNAAALHLDHRTTFAVGDWAAGLTRQFDIVISNPPYIPTGEIADLAAEVRREPVLALDGGVDGLVSYRAIIRMLDRLLAPEGLAAFEIGYRQGDAVSGLLDAAGFRPINRRLDLSGIERCLMVRART